MRGGLRTDRAGRARGPTSTASRALAAGLVALAGMVVLAALTTSACFEPPASGDYVEGPHAPPSPRRSDLRIAPDELPARVLRIGLAPILSRELMLSQHEALADHLRDVLGVPVELVVADSYGDLTDRLAAGRVDIAILPPATYALARARAATVRLLASEVAGGATSYSSYIVVRRDAPYQSLRDLVGKRIAFVDEASASGFVLPWSAFLDHGIDPASAFASVTFAGNHLGAIHAVMDGEADAAATYSGMLDFTRRTERGDDVAAGLRILHKAGRVPYDALCAAPGLAASVGDRVAAAFMAVNTSTALGRHLYALTSNHVSGWGPADPTQYESIERLTARVAAQRAAHRGGAHGRP